MADRARDIKGIDTGLALSLLALLSYQLHANRTSVTIAMILLLLCMTIPGIFSPLARPWFTIGEVLAKLFSTLILTLIFLLLVTPIGIIRRISGKDPLNLRQWHTGSGSLLRQREHRWQPDDLERPY